MVWKEIARDHGDALIHVVAYCSALTDLLDPPLSRSHESWVFELREQDTRWCGNERDFNELGRETLEKLGDEKNGLFELIEKESGRTIAALRESGFKFRDAPLARFSNGELASALEEVYEAWRQASKWGHIINLADFEHFELTNKIMAFIEKRVEENDAENGVKNEAAVPEAFAALTMPLEKSPFALQDEAFFEILAKIQGNARANELFQTQPAAVIAKRVEEFPEIDRAIHAHAREYDWLQYQYSGPVILEEAFFVEALASEARQGVDAKAKLREFAEKTRALREKQATLLYELRFSESEKRWLKIARSFMFLKASRKDAVFQASRNSRPLLEEIARRLNVPFQIGLYLTADEVSRALRGGSLEAAELDADALRSRFKHCVGLFERNKVTFISGVKAAEYSALITEEKAPVDAASVRELKGTPASPGKVRGTVKIIVTAEDMKKMRDGDVLVSPATNPNLVPAMKRAAAIVTNEGGVTCHAAIVSRELGVPCVTGTRIATRVLKDGDVVEVDANHGVVKLIKRA